MKLGILVIDGFKKTEYNADGMDAVQRELEESWEHLEEVKVYDLRQWKQSARGMVALMKRDEITHVVAVCYSHGVGAAFVKFSERALKAGIHIPLAIFCDGVGRPWWLPSWTVAQIASFRSLIPNSIVIELPEPRKIKGETYGIGEVVGLRQVKDIPRGHRIRIGKKGEPFEVDLIEDPKRTTLTIGHSKIDETPAFKELVRLKVREYIEKEVLK